MEYIIFENIVLKEVSEKQFKEDHETEEHEELLLELSDLLGTLPLDQDQQSALDITQSMLSRLKRSMRPFELYDGEDCIGYVTLSDHDTATPEVHIELCEEYHRRGIGYRALCHVIDEAFQDKEVDHLLYRVYQDNVASIALIKKCGGTLAEIENLGGGETINTYHIYRQK